MTKVISSRAALQFLVILVSMAIVQCGGETKSMQVKVTITPEKPIVITGDTKDGRGNDVTAPWIRFKVNIENTSESPLTIVGLRGTAVYGGGAGVSDTEFEISSSDISYTLSNGTPCDYQTFKVLPAKSASQSLAVCDPYDNDCDPLTPPDPVCATGSVGFYISNLNRPADEKNKNFRYRITLELLGWFGTPDNQEDRFRRSINFMTQ